MINNRNVIPEKIILERTVTKISKSCKTLKEFQEKLLEQNIYCYSRNNKFITGVWYGNRKFRFTTLGVDKSHLFQMTREQKRLQEIGTKSKPKNELGLRR